MLIVYVWLFIIIFLLFFVVSVAVESASSSLSTNIMSSPVAGMMLLLLGGIRFFHRISTGHHVESFCSGVSDGNCVVFPSRSGDMGFCVGIFVLVLQAPNFPINSCCVGDDLIKEISRMCSKFDVTNITVVVDFLLGVGMRRIRNSRF